MQNSKKPRRKPLNPKNARPTVQPATPNGAMPPSRPAKTLKIKGIKRLGVVGGQGKVLVYDLMR